MQAMKKCLINPIMMMMTPPPPTVNPPLLGLGHDILELDRIESSFQRYGEKLLDRILTEKEKAYCLKHTDPLPHIAGRFCAKEAIAKALGTGIGKELAWHDLEILNDGKGKPVVFISESAKKQFQNPHLLISISHSKTYVSSVALWLISQ